MKDKNNKNLLFYNYKMIFLKMFKIMTGLKINKSKKLKINYLMKIVTAQIKQFKIL